VPSVPWLSYAAAASEALYGVFLFVLPTVAIGHLFGVALHSLILLFIAGPLGPGGFHGIIGWKVFCLCWSLARVFQPTDLVLRLDAGSVAIVLCFFVVPLLNLTTGFGERVSFKMHSQNNAVYHFVVPLVAQYGELEPRYFSRLPNDYGVAEMGVDLCRTHVRMHLNLIALHEAYLMPPLSVRTAASLGRNLAQVFQQPVLVFFVPQTPGEKRVLVPI
jgi:hypothetical protein